MIIRRRLKTESTQSDRDQSWERFERKFFIPPAKANFARSLLSHICLPDRKYPQGTINSLYFDTPDLDHFQKSDDGNYERDKIRIRWYDNPGNLEGIVPVYLELKSKRGFISRKKRRKILVSAERLKRIQNKNTIVNMNIISGILTEFGYFSKESLVPVIVITYKRFRFIEILTGARLSFDCRISSTLTNHSLGHNRLNLMLEGGVIEIKSSSMEIPVSIRSLIKLGTDWTRFSKYAGCLESQKEKPGSVGSLWPSGRIELL
jgi:hypothetical protein